MKLFKKFILSICAIVFLVGCTVKQQTAQVSDDVDSVKAYLIEHEKLPDFYMRKKDARKEGWEKGALHLVVEGYAIGGDEFQNFEETLPVIDNRTYYECDIDTLNSESRGAKRIVYTLDPSLNIYYTDDHYKTFEKLYGDDDYVGNK